jgi:hypothetical protein
MPGAAIPSLRRADVSFGAPSVERPARLVGVSRWLGWSIAVVAVGAWLTLGFLPYTATKTVVVGSEAIYPTPISPSPSTLHVACHGLFSHDPANVSYSPFQFTSNPCLDGRGAKQAGWVVGLVVLLVLLGWVTMVTRIRRRSSTGDGSDDSTEVRLEGPGGDLTGDQVSHPDVPFGARSSGVAGGAVRGWL